MSAARKEAGTRFIYFQKNDAGRQQLLSDVELILRNPDITQEEVCQSISSEANVSIQLSACASGKLHISAVQLQGEEAEHQQWHDDTVNSGRYQL